MRTPVFELHIAPMIRATDREHMGFFGDLWDYDFVAEHADEILERLKTDMPTAATGGPWPDEWIAVFTRWKDGSRKRLQLGTATFTFSTTASAFTITATGSHPGPGYRGWLQLEAQTETTKTYVLYVEEPDAPSAGSPEAFTVKERYRSSDTRTVFVHDSAGVRQLHPPVGP
jgi:hypothetical protein